MLLIKQATVRAVRRLYYSWKHPTVYGFSLASKPLLFYHNNSLLHNIIVKRIPTWYNIANSGLFLQKTIHWYISHCVTCHRCMQINNRVMALCNMMVRNKCNMLMSRGSALLNDYSTFSGFSLQLVDSDGWTLHSVIDFSFSLVHWTT